MIEAARARAYHAVNTELIDLYWRVGEYISRKIAADGWGKNTVVALAEFIRRNGPSARGFSVQNLWRMRQFYETWHGSAKLSTLLRELHPNEVVEYALSRSASPALIAEYQTALPDKRLLQRKLHEFYQLSAPTLPEERTLNLRKKRRQP